MTTLTTVQLLAPGTAASAGDKTAVTIGMKTPFLPGRLARVVFDARSQTGTAPAWAIDGSVDNSTWVADLATSAVAAGSDRKDVILYKYMRVSVTTAAGSTEGTLGVHLESDK